VALFTWANLLNNENFKLNNCLFELTDFDKCSTDEKYEKILRCLAQSCLNLALPIYNNLSVTEALYIRDNHKDLLMPFWRTLKRLRSNIFLTINENTKYEDIKYQIDFVVNDTIGTSIESWAEEIENEFSGFVLKNFANIKKWGVTTISLVSGILKGDLEKIASTVFQVPTKANNPSQLIVNDFDNTIKFLHDISKYNTEKK